MPRIAIIVYIKHDMGRNINVAFLQNISLLFILLYYTSSAMWGNYNFQAILVEAAFPCLNINKGVIITRGLAFLIALMLLLRLF